MHTCINIYTNSNIYIYITYILLLSLSLIWYEGCRSVGAGKCDNEGGQFLGVGKEEECGAHSEYLQGRYEWIARDRRDEVYAAVTSKHPWMPEQTVPSGFNETILFGYAADGTPLPTYICLASGLYRSRTGRMVEREGRYQEIISLLGIFFFDGWRVQPSLKVPANVPQTKDVPDKGTSPGTPRTKMAEDKKEVRQPEEEARDNLRQPTRTKQRTAPTRDALLSERVSTLKYWWKGTEKSFTKCTRLLENTRNKARALLRANSSSNLLVAPCLRSPRS